MERCIGCEGSRDVQRVDDLPWCETCRDQDYPDLFATQCAPMFSDAVLAEVRRRHIPTPRDDKRFKPAETS